MPSDFGREELAVARQRRADDVGHHPVATRARSPASCWGKGMSCARNRSTNPSAFRAIRSTGVAVLRPGASIMNSGRWPRLTRVMIEAKTPHAADRQDRLFEAGLERVLDGLAAHLPPRKMNLAGSGIRSWCPWGQG